MPSDKRVTDRRSYLKYAGAATLTALAGCSGGGGGNGGGDDYGHEVPHPEDGTVPDAEMNAQALNGQERPDEPNQGKDAVGYAHEPSGDQYCGNCSLFVPDQDGDGFGACLLVKGKIHHCDYCNLWSSYTGDDVVECSA